MGPVLDPGRDPPYAPARMSTAHEGDPSADAVEGAAEGRARLLTWLAAGARDVRWGLHSVPRERWAADPPAHLAQTAGSWPALRHVRHLCLYASHVWLPGVRFALGAADAHDVPRLSEVEGQDAAWDARLAARSADDWIEGLGAARFDMLQLLESAPDDAWTRPLAPELIGANSQEAQRPALAWLVARGYQQELEHLSAIWKLALYWDRVPPASGAGSGLPLQTADRMESH